MTLWNIDGELTNPYDKRVNWYSPNGLTKASLCLSSSFKGICKNPSVRSKAEKYRDPRRAISKSLIVGNG